MTTLFILSVSFCLYVYGIYPLWLAWRATRARRLRQALDRRHARASEPVAGQGDADLPWVSIIVAARDEASRLPDKLESLCQLDYPADRLEVILVSDGSSDATASIMETAVRRERRWSRYHYPVPAGKPTALNLGVARASGEVLIFTDARQPVASGSVRALVDRLADPTVGAVSGELVLRDAESGDSGNVSLYWRYETWIRRNESHLHSTTGATGALYAIRRRDHAPLEDDVLLDDFDLPIRLLRRGLRTVLEPRARAYDRAEPDGRQEFRRKARTLAGNFQSFRRHPWLFDPRRNPVWWQFMSHKVFRLFVPYALLIAFLSALLGATPFLQAMLWVQVAFYAVGLAGLLGIENRLVTLVKVFLQLNAAAVVGAVRGLRGTASVHWKRT